AAHVHSERFGIRDFLDVWHMGSDPRYADLRGSGRVEANVLYFLGGPDDRCASGVLRVDGRAALTDFEVFGERYRSADADFRLNWWDMEAGDRGYDLEVSSLALRKSAGAILG